MLRKSKTVLKAITMGALLANGGVGTEGEDDKRKKDLNVPLCNAVHGAAVEATPEISGNGRGDFYRSLIEPYARTILSRVDERAEMRRELLRKPMRVDLRGEPIRGMLPFQKVLNTLLADAQKHDVLINLTLLNATQAELDEILNHENAQFIKELDWTYEARLIDDMDAYDWLEDEKTSKDEEWTDTSVGFTTDDADEEWIDEPTGFTTDDPDEEWIDELVGFTTDDPDEELIYDLLGFMGDDPHEEWIDEPVEAIRAGGPVPRFRRAVARARYMPALGELINNFGQKGIIAPPKEVVTNKGILGKENNNLQLSSWSMTPVKASENNMDPNSDHFNKLTHHASHNLVHIFCRENRERA